MYLGWFFYWKRNNYMNKTKKLIILLFGISLIMGCQIKPKNISSSENKRIEKSKKIKSMEKIYSVNITQVFTNDKGNFVVEGDTKAPSKSQIIAQPIGNKNAIDTDVSSKVNNEDDWATVNKGKFSTEISAEKLSESYTYKIGQVFPVKIIAVSGIKLKDADIPQSIGTLINKKKIKSYKLIADEKVVSKWNPIFKKEQLDDMINDLELDIDDNFKDYSVSEDDIEVTLVNKDTEIEVDVKVPKRSLFMPPGESGYMAPILKAIKDADLDSTIKYVDIDIYGDKKNEPIKFSVEKIKNTNWKNIDNLDNQELKRFIGNISEN